MKSVLRSFTTWLIALVIFIWLSTRHVTPRVTLQQEIKSSITNILDTTELKFLSERLACVWTSTLDYEDLPQYLTVYSTRFFRKFGKRRFSHCRVAYYSNSVATRDILPSGDIESNPRPNVQRVESRKYYLEQFVRSLDKSSSNLRIAHINIRSLRNKLDEIELLLKVCRFDVLSITDSHLDEKISNEQLNIANYKIVRKDRDDSSGGGCIACAVSHLLLEA